MQSSISCAHTIALSFFFFPFFFVPSPYHHHMMSFLATEKPLRTKASFIDLPRSTTNSSIASVFRRVKSSQQLRDRRSSSSESSYFSASQELPSSPSFSSVCSEAPEKLLRVVQELVETEVSYHKDMQLAEEFCHENPYFRQICGHLRCISEFEHEWVRLLQAAQESPDPGTAVGSLFIEKVRTYPYSITKN